MVPTNQIMRKLNLESMVRKGGLEPPCLSAPPPQDGVSANFTTSAQNRFTLVVCRISRLASAAQSLRRFNSIQRSPEGRQNAPSLMLPCPAAYCYVSGRGFVHLTR